MNRKSLIFVILALFIGVGLGTGGTLGVQKFFLGTSGESSTAHVKETKKTGPLLPIGEFTVNLQGGGFLKASITVQVTDDKAAETLKEEDAFLKDRVNTVLANKSLADVQNSTGREKLREDLVEKLNDVAENQVRDVLFLSLVYQ